MDKSIDVAHTQMYFYKLIPKRTNFAESMTPEEALIMSKHVQYWTALMRLGKVHAFGPVSDPDGTYGIGIVNVPDEASMKEFLAHDPAVASGLNRAEFHPMHVVHRI